MLFYQIILFVILTKKNKNHFHFKPDLSNIDEIKHKIQI
jgi:hypothetical protein